MPGWIGAVLDIVVIVLLLCALPLVLRLERRLAAVRQDRGAIEAGAAGLTEATRMAEAASLRLRASAETSGRQVAEKLAKAEPVRDDLKYLVERAESIADRLEALVRSARPALTEAPPAAAMPPPAPTVAAAAPHSQAERDLLRALLKGIPGSGR
jgi:hypothetical protein